MAARAQALREHAAPETQPRTTAQEHEQVGAQPDVAVGLTAKFPNSAFNARQATPLAGRFS